MNFKTLLFFTSFYASSAFAFVNVDGLSGGGIVPMAYVNRGAEVSSWFIVLPEANTNWQVISVNGGYKRVELGYAHHFLEPRPHGFDLGNIHMDVASVKFLLLKEGEITPAMAMGVSYKNTNYHPDIRLYHDKSSVEPFVVLTKTWAKSIVTNGGIRMTKTYFLGTFGNGDSYVAQPFFSAVYALSNRLAAGFEFESNVDTGKNALGRLKTHAIWDVFLSYKASEKISLGLSYMYSGHEDLNESLKHG